MTLDELLTLYVKILNPDEFYNKTILKENDRCAALAKYVYGFSLCCLICEIIRNENDYVLLEHLLKKYKSKIPFFYDIIPLLYKRSLILHPCIAGFNDFTEYIRPHDTQGSFADEIQRIDELVKQKRYDDALAIVNSVVRN